MPHTPLSRLLKTAAVSAALAAAACAHAQSSVSLVGLVDMSVGQFQAAGESKIKKAENGSMTTSFVGFRGKEDLGGGLTAIFTIDSFLRADTGTAGRFDGDAFWARDAFVGLSSSYGTVKLGRNTTPLFVSSLAFNAFGDSYGFSPTMRHVFLSEVLADSGWNNSIRIESPNFGGLNLVGMINAGEGGGVGRNTSLQALYFGGAFSGTLVWQQVKNGTGPFTPAGFEKQDTLQAGAAYDFGMVKLFGQYTEVKTEAAFDFKAKLASVGASVPIGAGKLLAQYGYTKYSDSSAKHKTISLGYDYDLSKRTDVYAAYMNDKFTGLNTGNSFAAGVRHRF
jgi:predicted porin